VKVACTDQALNRLAAVRELVAQDNPAAALRLVT
jgi:hypothetical protein